MTRLRSRLMGSGLHQISPWMLVCALLLMTGVGWVLLPAITVPTSAEITIKDAAIAQGDLWVAGHINEPNSVVTLDDSYTEKTDGRGRFQFRVAYHPATCTVLLKTSTQSRAVVIANCGQRGPQGESGPAGPLGPTAPTDPTAALTSVDSKAAVDAALPTARTGAVQEATSEGVRSSGTVCGARAALYDAEGGSKVWVVRKGWIGQDSALNPLSAKGQEVVLEANIAGKVVTAYGPDLGPLIAGGSPQQLEQSRGEQIKWQGSLDRLPETVQIASEDGSGVVARLRFVQCGSPPSGAREVSRQTKPKPPKAASAPRSAPAEAETPKAFPVPQGALQEPSR